ncbi:MAG: hypothetical protein ACI4PF_01305 [Christensenellales bacterium]
MGYDIKNFENYKSKQEEKTARDFHKSRIAFIILNSKVNYLENSEKSHYEWALEMGVDESKFNNIVRGYYKDKTIIFYKDNFKYDKEVIEQAKIYAKEIKNHCSPNSKCKIYCGLQVGEVGEVWKPDYFIKEF